MDSSDGLSISLYELARQSNVNFLIDNIPSAKGVCNFARNNRLDYKRLIFCGGEEYEIVGTSAPANLKKAKTTARRSKLKLFIIGKVEKGEGKVFLLDRKTGKRVQLKDMGYVHLNHRRKSG
jgi:thiamine-monophosphate kinase